MRPQVKETLDEIKEICRKLKEKAVHEANEAKLAKVIDKPTKQS